MESRYRCRRCHRPGQHARPQVYCISSGKTLPQWLSEKKRRSLKKDDDYRRRLELLQDLHFPTAAQRLKVTPDGDYLFASGIHPPQVCS